MEHKAKFLVSGGLQPVWVLVRQLLIALASRKGRVGPRSAILLYMLMPSNKYSTGRTDSRNSRRVLMTRHVRLVVRDRVQKARDHIA